MNKKQLNIVYSVLFFIPALIALYTCFKVAKFGGLETGHKLIIYAALIILAIVFGAVGSAIVHSKLTKIKRNVSIAIVVVLACLFVGINVYVSGLLTKVHDTLSNISTTVETYQGGIVTMKESGNDEVKDLKGKKIGYFDMTTSMENYIIPYTILEDEGIVDSVTLMPYEDMSILINALYEGDVDAIMSSANYTSSFENLQGFADVGLKTQLIAHKEESKEIEIDNAGTIDDLKKPFSVLLMGVDTNKPSKDGSLVGNADALFLATVNPENYTINITSIPRDSYTPIACYADKRRDKITHSNVGGTECVVNTVANMFDVDIPYFIKINFKGLEDLVDALGGVYVTVDESKYPNGLVGQNGKRYYEEGYEWIWVPPGTNKVSGEQALAFARVRKSLDNGATERAANQTLVINGIINAFFSVDGVSRIYDVLDVVGKNIQTNFTVDQMTSFYKLGMDILNRSKGLNMNESIIVDYFLVSGYDRMIYNEKMEMLLYNYVPFEGSIKDIKAAIHKNLGLEKYDVIGKFDYNAKVPYKKDNAVFYYYNEKQETFKMPDLVPDMYGYTLDQAISWANSRGIGYSIKDVLPGDALFNENLENGFVIGHNQKVNRKSANVSHITFSVIKKGHEEVKYPTIVLEPNVSEIKVQKGDSSWQNKLPSAKGYDGKGNDITDKIVITGKNAVKYNEDGTYKLVYSITADSLTTNYELYVVVGTGKATSSSSSSTTSTSSTSAATTSSSSTTSTSSTSAATTSSTSEATTSSTSAATTSSTSAATTSSTSEATTSSTSAATTSSSSTTEETTQATQSSSETSPESGTPPAADSQPTEAPVES